MFPGDLEFQRQAPSPGGTVELQIRPDQADPGRGRAAIADHAFPGGFGLFGQGQGAFVVGAGHQQPFGRQQPDERGEGSHHGLGSSVVVQMIRLGVRQHLDPGPVVQERTVGLIRFRDEDPAAPGRGVDPQSRHVSADRE